MTEKAMVWITKYALTAGIEVKWVDVCSETMVREIGTQFPVYYHGRDWHRTREEAVKRAEEMLVKKIASLEKHLAAYRKLKFG